MTTKQRQRHMRGRGSSRKLRLWTHLSLLLGFLLPCSVAVQAAYTEPRLALLRVTPYRSTSGSVSLKLEGSFSFADAVQLALPLTVTITQGQLRARFDLAGNVFTSVAGGAEEPAAGPGVIAIAPRALTLILPAGFSAGTAAAQVTASYEGEPIASNRLSFTL